MDVYLFLVSWLQVVMDNGQEKAKQRKLDLGSCFEKKEEMLWDNAFVHCTDLFNKTVIDHQSGRKYRWGN